MHNSNPEHLEKVRQQFDYRPFPPILPENSKAPDYNFRFIHSLTTPFYLRDRAVTLPTHKVILDLGCGSGLKTIGLAEANPDAEIIGVDVSPRSIEVAQQQLGQHNHLNIQFYNLDLEHLSQLNRKFDYINCDELLYLFPKPSEALKIMAAVLTPQGIIRANLHSALQRQAFSRAQELFRFMGLMEGNPEELEIDLVSSFFQSLKDDTDLKRTTFWKGSPFQGNDKNTSILMNYLFQGDQSFRINELFTMLEMANLEFLSMVNWRKWDLLSLFQTQSLEELPPFLAMAFSQLSTQEQLYLFELIQPIHRLFDFWCCLPQAKREPLAISEWQDSHWQKAKISLHPQLQMDAVKQTLILCVRNQSPFHFTQFINLNNPQPVLIESSVAACLLPLWEGPQSVQALVDRRLYLSPYDGVTLQARSAPQVWQEVCQLLQLLESSLHVLIEQC
jgi:ubiquinone/menaquinone biosynthesis C-methylase UbiE